jgi:hypothetical protein
MSGCYQSNMGQVCIHGIDPINHTCNFCQIERRISDSHASLNNRIESLHYNKLQQIDLNQKAENEFKGIKQAVNVLHEHRIMQIDENRKISKRIDEIQNTQAEVINHCVDRLNELENKENHIFSTEIQRDVTHLLNRIYDIEKEIKKCYEANPLQPINERFENLEKQLIEVKRFQDITHEQYMTRKRPHKCPVCGGCGLNKNILSSIPSMFPVCESCEGKGIIWG